MLQKKKRQPDDQQSLSKFLSLVLRHQPELVGIELEYHGAWANVEALIDGTRRRGWTIDRQILDEIVRTDAKGRYAYNAEGDKIRACQGHSVDVWMDYQPVQPPETLYHGTTAYALDSIRAGGLKPMGRQYVHLSSDEGTARNVGGRRRGETIVLTILSGEAGRCGYTFYQADNGVWLVQALPPDFIEFPSLPTQ